MSLLFKAWAIIALLIVFPVMIAESVLRELIRAWLNMNIRHAVADNFERWKAYWRVNVRGEKQ